MGDGEGSIIFDCERQVVEPDVGTTIERDRGFGVGDPPKREPCTPVRYGHHRIGLVPPDLNPAKNATEEFLCGLEIGHCQAHVMYSTRQWLAHRFLRSRSSRLDGHGLPAAASRLSRLSIRDSAIAPAGTAVDSRDTPVDPVSITGPDRSDRALHADGRSSRPRRTFVPSR